MDDWGQSDHARSYQKDVELNHHRGTIQDYMIDWRKCGRTCSVHEDVRLGYYKLNGSPNCREHHANALMGFLTKGRFCKSGEEKTYRPNVQEYEKLYHLKAWASAKTVN